MNYTMTYILVLIGFTLTGVYQVISLIKENRKKEIIVYVILLLPGLVLLYYLSQGVQIPDYHNFIKNIIAPITESIN